MIIPESQYYLGPNIAISVPDLTIPLTVKINFIEKCEALNYLQFN